MLLDVRDPDHHCEEEPFEDQVCQQMLSRSPGLYIYCSFLETKLVMRQLFQLVVKVTNVRTRTPSSCRFCQVLSMGC